MIVVWLFDRCSAFDPFYCSVCVVGGCEVDDFGCLLDDFGAGDDARLWGYDWAEVAAFECV